jgi:hypothetical protein
MLIEEDKTCESGENKQDKYCYVDSEIFTDYFILDFKNRVLIPSPRSSRNSHKPSYRQKLFSLSGKLLEFEPGIPDISDQVVSRLNLDSMIRSLKSNLPVSIS